MQGEENQPASKSHIQSGYGSDRQRGLRNLLRQTGSTNNANTSLGGQSALNQSDRGNRSFRTTGDNMTAKQEAFLKNKLKTLVSKNNLDSSFGPEDIQLKQRLASLGNFDEQRELHETLKELRSKYDSMVEECVKKERRLKNIQDEIASINVQKEKISKEEVECEQNLENAETNLKTVQEKLKQVTNTKKTYEYMLERVKRDHLIRQADRTRPGANREEQRAPAQEEARGGRNQTRHQCPEQENQGSEGGQRDRDEQGQGYI